MQVFGESAQHLHIFAVNTPIFSGYLHIIAGNTGVFPVISCGISIIPAEIDIFSAYIPKIPERKKEYTVITGILCVSMAFFHVIIADIRINTGISADITGISV